MNRTCARNAALAPPTRDDRSMAGHAAGGGEDADRAVHAINIFGARFLANKNNLFAL